MAKAGNGSKKPTKKKASKAGNGSKKPTKKRTKIAAGKAGTASNKPTNRPTQKATGKSGKSSGSLAAKAPSWATGENREPKRLDTILAALTSGYPDAALILRFENPFQLLVATILAAQSTDERVNLVAPHVFERWPGPVELAAAPVAEVEDVVHSTGFFRQKAQRLVEVSAGLNEHFESEVPRTVEELTSLSGVGKKTAILVINHAYQIPVGVAVDTHVRRIAQRLDWSHAANPDQMEAELRELLPQSSWIRFQDLIATHGRAACRARKPTCIDCPIRDLCYAPDRHEPDTE